MTPDPLRVTEDALNEAAAAMAAYDGDNAFADDDPADEGRRRHYREYVLAALPHLVPKPEGEPSKDALREAFENGRYMERQKQAVDTARPKPEGVEGDPLEWAWELLEKAGYPEAALEARDAWRPYRDRQREAGRE